MKLTKAFGLILGFGLVGFLIGLFNQSFPMAVPIFGGAVIGWIVAIHFE